MCSSFSRQDKAGLLSLLTEGYCRRHTSTCRLHVWVPTNRLLYTEIQSLRCLRAYSLSLISLDASRTPKPTPKHPLLLTMEDAHTLSINSHVNLASGATVAEADAFMKPFNLSINVVKSASEDGESAQVGYFDRRTRRWYRTTASLAELHEGPTRDWLQQLTDLFPWATLVEGEEGEKELRGRLLGTSGTVDGLQGCDVGKVRVVDVGELSISSGRRSGACAVASEWTIRGTGKILERASLRGVQTRCPWHLLAMLSYEASRFHAPGYDAL